MGQNSGDTWKFMQQLSENSSSPLAHQFEDESVFDPSFLDPVMNEVAVAMITRFVCGGPRIVQTPTSFATAASKKHCTNTLMCGSIIRCATCKVLLYFVAHAASHAYLVAFAPGRTWGQISRVQAVQDGVWQRSPSRLRMAGRWYRTQANRDKETLKNKGCADGRLMDCHFWTDFHFWCLLDRLVQRRHASRNPLAALPKSTLSTPTVNNRMSISSHLFSVSPVLSAFRYSTGNIGRTPYCLATSTPLIRHAVGVRTQSNPWPRKIKGPKRHDFDPLYLHNLRELLEGGGRLEQWNDVTVSSLLFL